MRLFSVWRCNHYLEHSAVYTASVALGQWIYFWGDTFRLWMCPRQNFLSIFAKSSVPAFIADLDIFMQIFCNLSCCLQVPTTNHKRTQLIIENFTFKRIYWPINENLKPKLIWLATFSSFPVSVRAPSRSLIVHVHSKTIFNAIWRRHRNARLKGLVL